MSDRKSDEPETLRDRLYAAAPGREDQVDELLEASSRGSNAIEGIRFPQTTAPPSIAHKNPSSSASGDQ